MNTSNFGKQGAVILQLAIIVAALLAAITYLKWAFPDREECVSGGVAAACAVRAVADNVRLFNPLATDDFTVEWVGGGERRVAYDPGWAWVNDAAAPRFQSMLLGAGGFLFGTILIGNVLLMAIGRHHKKASKKHQRGAQIVAAKKLAKQTSKEVCGGLTIAGVQVPAELEPLSFRFAGSPGSGKSQCINRLALEFRRRGDPAVIADSGGELMAALARPQDTILNPFDRRSAAWSPFAEIVSIGDADRFSNSLIPEADGEDAQWNRYARQVLTATLMRLRETGRATNGWLTFFCCAADKSEWSELVAGTPAQRWFSKENERPFGSIAGIISTYITPISYLPPEAGSHSFSITKWVRSARETQAVLWLPYRPESRGALKDLIAGWIELATVTAMALEPDQSRRLWIVIDELCALGRISSLQPALAEGRKFGLSALVGYQSIAQLRQVYGPEGHRAVLSCLQSVLALRTSDFDSAEALSKDLGEAEVAREEHSRSARVGEISSNTTREARAVERVVLASEIQSLPKLRGFLKLAGDFPIAAVEIPLIRLKKTISPFIAASGVASQIVRPVEPQPDPSPASDLDDGDIDELPDPDVQELDEELQAEIDALERGEQQ